MHDTDPADPHGSDELASVSPMAPGTRRRRAALGAAVALVMVASLALVLAERPDTTKPRNRAAAPHPASSPSPSQPPSTSPPADDSHARFVAGLADMAEVRRVLALPDVRPVQVEYSSPTDAVALLYDPDSEGDFKDLKIVVLVTHDDWVTSTAGVIAGDHADAQMLPGGGAAIAVYADITSDGSMISSRATRFIVHEDGSVSRVRALRGRHVPARGALFAQRSDDFGQYSLYPDDLWVLDPARSLSYRPPRPPCHCRSSSIGGPVIGADGTGHILFWDYERTGLDVLLAHSRNAGRRWRTQPVNVSSADGESAYAFAAGAHGQLAFIASSEDQATPVTRALYVSDDGRSWRRIPTPRLPRYLTNIGDLAFAPDGTLLAARDGLRQRLLQVSPGSSVLRPLLGGPRAYSVSSSGGGLVAFKRTNEDTVAVSSDGRRWRTVRPDRAVLQPVH